MIATDLEALAGRQHNLFTATQARELGASRATVAYHSRMRGWTAVLPGVYRIGEPAEGFQQRYLAAQLWAGTAAVISHGASNVILGLDGIHWAKAELITPRSLAHAKVVVHHQRIAPSETVMTGMLRHTTPLRTVRDLAVVGTNDDTLELIIESILRRQPALEPKLRVIKGLHSVMTRRDPGEPATESELETLFIQLVRGHLPKPVRQYPIRRWRVDVSWPEAKLWVECDGKETHGGNHDPTPIYKDVDRQNGITKVAGGSLFRLTWAHVVHQPDSTRALVQEHYLNVMRR